MNISQAAQASGLSSKAIRYYEDVGLIVPARNASNGYRVYSLQDVECLGFLQQARTVGFDLEVCRELLVLYSDPGHRCERVKTLVMEKIERVDQQLEGLARMRATLARMASECGDGENNDRATNKKISGGISPQSVGVSTMAFTLLGEDGIE